LFMTAHSAKLAPMKPAHAPLRHSSKITTSQCGAVA